MKSKFHCIVKPTYKTLKRVGDHPGSVTVYTLVLGPGQNLCDNTHNVSPAQYTEEEEEEEEGSCHANQGLSLGF